MNRKLTQFWAAALGVVILATASPVLAQGGGRSGSGGPGRGGFGRGGFGRGFSILRMSPPVQARLNLSATQKSKIQAISDKARQDVRSAFGQGGGGGDRQAAFEKIRTLNSRAEAEALKVLNPTQKKQYDALKGEATAYAGLGRPGSALLAIPDLTAAQKTKLKALATQSGAKRDKLFSGGSGGGDRSAVFEKARALDSENTAAVKKILTPAQQKKFDAAIAASGRGRGGPGGPGGNGGRRPGGSRTE